MVIRLLIVPAVTGVSLAVVHAEKCNLTTAGCMYFLEILGRITTTFVIAAPLTSLAVFAPLAVRRGNLPPGLNVSPALRPGTISRDYPAFGKTIAAQPVGLF
jgi:hypothetical protein